MFETWRERHGFLPYISSLDCLMNPGTIIHLIILAYNMSGDDKILVFLRRNKIFSLLPRSRGGHYGNKDVVMSLLLSPAISIWNFLNVDLQIFFSKRLLQLF